MVHGISHKQRMVVEALLLVAHHAAHQPLGGKKLANTLGIPPRYLELWLQALVKAGILRSIRGPRGGYMLACERSTIRMDAVMRACEQEKDTLPLLHSPLQHNVIAPLFIRAEEAFYAAMQTVTLEDVLAATDAERLIPSLSTVPSARITSLSERIDFSI
jgi:Rrf2 family transcriptional regulator, iron-sulfur cluster assembly transcription factor